MERVVQLLNQNIFVISNQLQLIYLVGRRNFFSAYFYKNDAMQLLIGLSAGLGL